jgi:hypothetical protein
MTDKASPDQSKEEPDMARFLQDWTALWRDELQAQANDPEGIAGTMELWRAAMTAWTGALGVPPFGVTPAGMPPTGMPPFGMPPMSASSPREHGSPWAPAVAVASDPRDAEIERLARRVDELETRLAKLETTRRARG